MYIYLMNYRIHVHNIFLMSSKSFTCIEYIPNNLMRILSNFQKEHIYYQPKYKTINIGYFSNYFHNLYKNLFLHQIQCNVENSFDQL